MSRIIITRGYRSPEHADFYLREPRPDPSDFQSLGDFANSLDLDLAHLAHGLFKVEEAYRTTPPKKRNRSEKKERLVDLDGTIIVLVDRLTVWDQPEIRELVSNIIGLTLHATPEIRFLNTPRHEEKAEPGYVSSPVNSICLFSGGIDSLSGIMNTATSLGPTKGVFVHHTKKSKRVVDSLVADQLLKNGISVETIELPMSGSHLQQLRGFLYLSIAAIVARICRTDKIVVSETGPIMYQPELTALDEVTVTTHPFLIRTAKRLFKDIYSLDFSFYEPFENLTKAEVVACCPDKNAIRRTHSCIRTAYAGQSYPQCGNCYGCLVRRLSCIVAGVQDCDYGRDVFMRDLGERIEGGWSGTSISESTMNDLRALLQFAREILEDRLPDSTAFKIRQFKKDDLFHRFALDVFASLYLAYDKERTGRNNYCRKFYEQCVADGVVAREVLSNRVEEVRAQKYKPDFAYKI